MRQPGAAVGGIYLLGAEDAFLAARSALRAALASLREGIPSIFRSRFPGFHPSP